MRYSLLLAALATTTLFSACHLVGGGDHNGGCPGPAPTCVGGTIVGFTCMDGPLIDVDARYPIGVPTLLHNGKRVDNLIVIVNRDVLGRLDSVGQHVYFKAVNDPNYQWNGATCLAADGVGQSVPHLVLSNLSATRCDSTLVD